MSGKFKQIPYNLDIGSKQTIRRNASDDSFEVVEIYSKGESDTQLSNKVDKEVGKGLSTNDYTTTEKNKLDGIEPGAEVNTINSIIAGTNIHIDNTDPLNPIISASGGGGGGGAVDSVNGQTGEVVLDADDISDTTTTKKFTTAGDISKLAGIEAGAEVNNISDVNATDLTDGGDSTLHYHASDRNRANHTGTQSISTVTNLQTELDKQKGIILSDTDANTITTGGRYGMIGTPTNGAITGEFALEVFNDGTRVMQIATYLSGVVYTRYYNGSAWVAWVKYSDDAKANISGATFSGRVETSEATAVASASTVDLNTINGNFVHITGTTTINSFGATARGSYELCFDSAGLTITNGAIRLPTGANIVTQAGDTMIVRGETTTGDWRVISYQRKDGSALSASVVTQVKFGGTGADGALSISSGTTTLTLSNDFVEKNYSSINISGTALLNITGVSGVNGGVASIKCRGDFTMSGGTIQMNGQGGAGGAGANSANSGAGTAGLNYMYYYPNSNGGNGTITYTTTGGAGGTGRGLSPLYSLNKLKAYAGGGGGGAVGAGDGQANGARGGGILIIEVGGAINFTGGTIQANGAVGGSNINSSGSGGGGGGFICIMYNTLTATSGVVKCDGGAGGAGTNGGFGRAGGGGGAGYSNGGAGGGPGVNGTAGTSNSWGTGGAGGAGTTNVGGGGGGGAGYYEIVKNNEIA